MNYQAMKRLGGTLKQSNVSAFQHAVQVCYSFPAKKLMSSDFMAAVTICSDFRAQEEEICHYFHLFPPLKVKMKVAQSCPALCDPWTTYSPWNSPGHNTGVGSLSLLQGIFPTQGLNPGLLHCRQILYQLSHREAPLQLYLP